MTFTAWRVYRAALAEDADVYQIHDPELLPWALLLRLHGKRVIYDVHEDAAGTVAYKAYLPGPVRSFVSWMVKLAESACARWFDAIIAATPHLAGLAERFGPPVVVVQNFPRLDEVSGNAGPGPYAGRPLNIVYAGGIARVRGIYEMLDAMVGLTEQSDATLHLAGRWLPSELREEVAQHPGWDRAIDHGLLNRLDLVALLGSCRIGLVTIWPEQNYLNSYATKMFEYMGMGLPVVASDFPLWRQIVEGAGCGLLVDPRDAGEIRDAIAWLFAHPSEAEAMGKRGAEAVRARYNWDWEATKLVALYESLGGMSEV